MTQANSNVSSIGKDLQQDNTVAMITQKDKDAAARVLKMLQGVSSARMTLQKKGMGLFGALIREVFDGATFAGMEGAEPELLKNKAVNATYRPIKSTIESAKALGISLIDDKGKPQTKKALSDAIIRAKAKKAGIADSDTASIKDLRDAMATDKKDADGKTEKTGTVNATPQQIVDSALAHLETSAELRAFFAARVRAVAKALANDEAVRAELKERAKAEGKKSKAQKDAEAEARAKAEADKLQADYAAAGLTKVGPEAPHAEPEAPHAETEPVTA